MVKHTFFKITIFHASSLICSNLSGLMEGCLSKQTEEEHGNSGVLQVLPSIP